MASWFKCLAVSVLVVSVAAASASAARLDLTLGGVPSGTINGAIFQRDITIPSGSGVLHPIVRIQAPGTEQGYNTSGRPVPFDEKTDPNFTLDLQLYEMPVVGGYYEFILDINEPGTGPENLLSLDAVQIYTSPIGSQTTTNVSSLGTLRYDLDAGEDNHVFLDYLIGGSGQTDMRAKIPVSNFAGVDPNDYVYLYSHFGEEEFREAGARSSESGYEEWAVVPEPGSLGLVLTGLWLVLGRRRRGAA